VERVAGNRHQLAGKWGFTTISGTDILGSEHRAYMGSGTGGSQSYTFMRNGSYKMFNYIKARPTALKCRTLPGKTVLNAGDGDRYHPASHQRASIRSSHPAGTTLAYDIHRIAKEPASSATG
jgi:hypothetical protein